MKFLPFENITYKSKLSKEEIISLLAEQVEPERSIFSFSLKERMKPYEGAIIENTFNIKRISNRNSFVPIIRGEILEEENGTTIKITSSIQTPIIIFYLVIFWFLFSTMPSIFASTYDPRSMAPYMIFLFFYPATMIGFKYESNKSKKFLKALFETEILKDQQIKRFPENSTGDFYTEYGICLACGAPEAEAPDLIGHSSGNYNHCYFKRQPQTEEETERAIIAVAVSCVSGLRSGGKDEKILKRLYELGEEDQCDHKLS